MIRSLRPYSVRRLRAVLLVAISVTGATLAPLADADGIAHGLRVRTYAPSSTAPAVVAQRVVSVDATSVSLEATVDTGLSPTTVEFRIGPTQDPVRLTTVVPATSTTDGQVRVYTATVTGLQPSTTYYYQVRAENQVDRMSGIIDPFTTTAAEGTAGAMPPFMGTPCPVTLPAPPGTVGITINDGAQYTNDPQVTISVVWQFCTEYLLVANDGGFRRAKRFETGPEVPWRLDSSGPERLPKTVYVRLGSMTQNFTDDIILDETAPILSSAAIAGGAGAARAARTIVVRTTARDATSGLGGIQITANRREPGTAMRYAKLVRASVAGRRIWVRVLDRAGNASTWKSLSTGG